MPQPRKYKRPPLTAEVLSVEKKEGETVPRRNVRKLKELKSTPEPDVKNVYDSLRWSGQRYSNAKLIRKRRLIELYEENGKAKKVIDGTDQEVNKQWTYYELLDYEYLRDGRLFGRFATVSKELGLDDEGPSAIRFRKS